MLFAILQMYDFSSKSQRETMEGIVNFVVCDTANVRFFKQITTSRERVWFAISCLRYCKCTIFQANHNMHVYAMAVLVVVCDTANVRFFKQITTNSAVCGYIPCCLRYCKCTIFQANHNDSGELVDTSALFAILQMYDFSSKSQLKCRQYNGSRCCLRYCKCTIFQANHNL